MKKMLCMILALVMALSLTVPAVAETTMTKGEENNLSTAVTYDTGNEETWTVTVPEAVAVDGEAKAVKAEGYWAQNMQLEVSVTNTSILLYYGEMKASATVTFGTAGKWVLQGSTVEKTSGTENLSVKWANSVPVVGTWSGTITYNVVLTDYVTNNQGGGN